VVLPSQDKKVIFGDENGVEALRDRDIALRSSFLKLDVSC